MEKVSLAPYLTHQRSRFRKFRAAGATPRVTDVEGGPLDGGKRVLDREPFEGE